MSLHPLSNTVARHILKKGQIELAFRDFNYAVQINPDSPSPYGARGAAYRKLGQQAQADADFAKYKQIAPNFPIP